MGEYGVVANVRKTDRVFRSGAKAWLVNWFSGGERATWRALSRGGRPVIKVSPVTRFADFRVVWLPGKIANVVYVSGTRAEMEKLAERLSINSTL